MLYFQPNPRNTFHTVVKVDISGMDTWTKTMVAIKVLTAFKKRRKKKKEAEEKEKIAKEKRKNLWRRLGFKLR